MNRHLAQLWRIYLSAYQSRRNIGSMWPVLLIFALAFAAPAVFYLTVGRADRAQATLLMLGLVSFVIASSCWFVFVIHMLKKCTPADLQLVPGLRPAMTTAFLLAWALLGGLPAALGAFAYGHFVLFWLCSGLALLSFGLTVGTGNPTYAAPLVASGLCGRQLAQFVHGSPLFSGDLLWLAGAACAMLAAAVITARYLFGSAGDRSIARHRSLAMRVEAMSLGCRARSNKGLTGFINGSFVYDYCLNRLLSKPSGRGTVPPGLLRMGFGSGLHWCFAAGNLLYSFGCAVLLLAIAYAFPHLRAAMIAMAFGVALSPASMLCGQAVMNFVKAIHQSRNEQGLLLLLPGCPRGDDMNRYLARLALRQIALATGLSLLVVVLVSAWQLLDGNANGMFNLLAAIWLGSFTVSAFIFRDYAAMRNANVASVKMAFFPTISTVALIIMLSTRGFSAPTCLLAAFMVVATAVMMRWRWKKMIGAPPALPAGRMAKE